MLFNSFEFLLFLPCVFLIYWYACRGRRSRNLWIVLCSYFFYGWWDWRFTGLLALTSLCSYASGIWEERYPRWARHILWSNILLNLGILGAFKYFNFFADSLQDLSTALGFGTLHAPVVHVILPVGISFYTFQALSYSIDIYRKKLPATHDLIEFFAYLSFFPQLVAGPIERATNLLPQFQQDRTFSYADAVDGMRQILWGFFKKIVIADQCAVGVNAIFSDYAQASGVDLLMGGLLFTFQIYGDFSGYSDIAIGTGRLFGIRLMQNFRYPYFSRNIRDFWQRWHISLMTWFRDYIYFPLGGSRCSRAKQLRNTFIVFLISGLWHGANWTFVCWGLYHACLFVPSILRGHKAEEKSLVGIFGLVRTGGQIFLTFFLVMLGWILFRSATLTDAAHYLTRMFTTLRPAMPTHGKQVLIYVALMLAVEWWQRHRQHALQFPPRFLNAPLRFVLYYAIIVAIFFAMGAGTAFIYFQF